MSAFFNAALVAGTLAAIASALFTRKAFHALTSEHRARLQDDSSPVALYWLPGAVLVAAAWLVVFLAPPALASSLGPVVLVLFAVASGTVLMVNHQRYRRLALPDDFLRAIVVSRLLHLGAGTVMIGLLLALRHVLGGT